MKFSAVITQHKNNSYNISWHNVDIITLQYNTLIKNIYTS